MASCLFCKIAEKEIPSQILYEDEEVVCFQDVNPKAPVHLLVIPRKHLPTHLDVGEEHEGLMGRLHTVINKVAREKGLDHDGFRVVLNCKELAGQSVNHLHFHLMGGRAFHWPPG